MDSTVLIKLDLNGFYFAGVIEDLAHGLCGYSQTTEAVLFRGAVVLLLSQQYMLCSELMLVKLTGTKYGEELVKGYLRQVT